MHILMLWCNFWRYDIRFDVMTNMPYFLTSSCTSWVTTYFLTSIHDFWRYDVLYDIFLYFMTYFMMSWHTSYNYLFDIMTYFLTSLHSFGCRVVLFHDVPFDTMPYFYLLTFLWRSFWRYDVYVYVLIDILMSWHTFSLLSLHVFYTF